MAAAPLRKTTFCLVLLALLVIQIGFGAYGVIVTKFAKKANVDPLIFCLYRDGCCFPVLFLATYVAEKKILFPNMRDLPLFVAMGFVGMFLNQLMYLLGVYYTSPDIASMFQPAIVVWTVIVSVIARTEKFPDITTLTGAARISGILLACGGAVVMNFGKSSLSSKDSGSFSGKSWFGYIALVINTLSVSIYIVIQKKYIFSVPTSRWKDYPIAVTAWAYLFGFVSMAIASLYYVNQPEKFYLHSPEVAYTLIYAVLIASALCYMLITWCNMLVSSTLVTAAWPLQVFFCIILSYILLGETLSAIEVVGGVLIILAMLTVVWSNYRYEIENSSDLMASKKALNSDDEDCLIPPS